MSVLREPRAAAAAPARAVGKNKVLLSGPTARLALLNEAQHAAYARGLADGDALRERLKALGVVDGAADSEALARDLVEGGLLNWSGPGEHALIVSGGGEVMLPETAKECVDFLFATPRPTLMLEVVDLDGRGWPAAWFAIEYARRKAEWGKRGLAITYRGATRPAGDRAERLEANGVAFRSVLAAVGPPDRAAMFPSPRALVSVGPDARDPEKWVDALASNGVVGVRWAPTRAALASRAGAARAADFMARALDRMIERHENSDLRDELALALLAGRPWELPGLDLIQTLAYAPDGRVWTSEVAWSDAEAGAGEAFVLGHASSLRFQDLPSLPVVPAIAATALRPSHPVCDACAYRAFCALPASSPEGLGGASAESPVCAIYMGLLDAVCGRLDDEKCLKALEKWGVDISRFTC